MAMALEALQRVFYLVATYTQGIRTKSTFMADFLSSHIPRRQKRSAA